MIMKYVLEYDAFLLEKIYDKKVEEKEKRWIEKARVHFKRFRREYYAGFVVAAMGIYAFLKTNKSWIDANAAKYGRGMTDNLRQAEDAESEDETKEYISRALQSMKGYEFYLKKKDKNEHAEFLNRYNTLIKEYKVKWNFDPKDLAKIEKQLKKERSTTAFRFERSDDFADYTVISKNNDITLVNVQNVDASFSKKKQRQVMRIFAATNSNPPWKIVDVPIKKSLLQDVSKLVQIVKFDSNPNTRTAVLNKFLDKYSHDIKPIKNPKDIKNVLKTFQNVLKPDRTSKKPRFDATQSRNNQTAKNIDPNTLFDDFNIKNAENEAKPATSTNPWSNADVAVQNAFSIMMFLHPNKNEYVIAGAKSTIKHDMLTIIKTKNNAKDVSMIIKEINTAKSAADAHASVKKFYNDDDIKVMYTHLENKKALINAFPQFFAK